MLTLLVDDCVRASLSRASRRILRRRLRRMTRAVWLSEPTERELEVNIRITDDAGIRALNREYRGEDRATDVLAFAAREAPGSEHNPEILGDIVISLDTATRQAGEDVMAELFTLATHGLCHLLGYDHQDEAQEQAMQQRMTELLAESRRYGPTQPA